MILEEAVDNFAFRLGKSADVVAKEKIEYDILTAYATIVERKLSRKSLVGTSLVDSILMNMEVSPEPVIPKSELYSKNAKLMVTSLEVPRALATPTQDCAYAISSKSGESSFTFIKPDRIKHRHRRVSKFISEHPQSYFTFMSRKIYSYVANRTIRVTAVFANPKEIAIFKRTDKTESLVVHIDNDIFTGIKALMINEYPEYAPLKKEDREIENLESNVRPR